MPGRLAHNYLAGQRVRYIAPLRLFVILSLLTFFVGKATMDLVPTEGDAPGGTDAGARMMSGPSDERDAPFAAATDADQVMAVRQQRLEELVQGREDPFGRYVIPIVQPTVRMEVDAAARRRLATLGTPEAQVVQAFARADAQAAELSGAAGSAAAKPTKDRDEGWLHRYLSRKSERVSRNMQLFSKDPAELLRLFLGALPGALFVLVPLFALFLKLVYFRSDRGYLEHLVIALYSHAALLVGLLVIFLTTGISQWLPWSTLPSNVIGTVIALGLPLYLLLMQKRVYGQGWLKTLIKYLVIGLVYSQLLGLAIAYAFVAGLSS